MCWALESRGERGQLLGLAGRPAGRRIICGVTNGECQS
jgi:hypothetical protein